MLQAILKAFSNKLNHCQDTKLNLLTLRHDVPGDA
jgi:hypothetical protein